MHTQELLWLRGQEKSPAPRRGSLHLRGQLLWRSHLPDIHHTPHPPSVGHQQLTAAQCLDGNGGDITTPIAVALHIYPAREQLD